MSVATSLSLNQDTSVSNLRKRTENSGAPDMAKQQAWLKAMEQSQMQEWLRQGLTARGGHEEALPERGSSSRDLSQTYHQDSAEKTSVHERGSDVQTASHSNGNGRQAAATDVVYERNLNTQNVIANEALPVASAVQRWTTEPMMVTLESVNSSVKQQASAPDMGAFAQDSLASSFEGVQPLLANENMMAELPGDFAPLEQTVQAVKMALQEMTGLGARIVSAESLNQMTGVDKQIIQPLNKLTASLATSVTDTPAPEMSEVKEESASAQTADIADSLSEEHEAIRFHAEWSEEGLRLWLGIDSNANIDKAQLAKQLHDWVAKQNVQLLALIWNGEQLSKNMIAQILKDGNKPSASSQTSTKPADDATIPGAEDTHYFFSSYLQVKSQAKEMQWPSVQ